MKKLHQIRECIDSINEQVLRLLFLLSSLEKSDDGKHRFELIIGKRTDDSDNLPLDDSE